MTNMVEGRGGAADCVFSLFWSFNRLAGAPVKKVYRNGLAAIGLAALAGIVWATGLSLSQPGAAAQKFFIIAALMGGGVVAWRFACALAEGLSVRRA